MERWNPGAPGVEQKIKGDRMNIELTTAQFLGLAALALAGGVAIGISIGIRLYSRYGRAGR